MKGIQDGYTIDHEVDSGKLITLFSAPDYPQFQVVYCHSCALISDIEAYWQYAAVIIFLVFVRLLLKRKKVCFAIKIRLFCIKSIYTCTFFLFISMNKILWDCNLLLHFYFVQITNIFMHKMNSSVN